MVKIPDNKVWVSGGSLKTGAFVRLFAETNGEVIKLSLCVDSEQMASIDEPRWIELDEVGPAVLATNLDFVRDIFRLEPRDMECLFVSEDVSSFDRLELIAAIAAVRSIRLVRIDVENQNGEAVMRRISVNFDRTSIILNRNFYDEDEAALMSGPYFVSR